MRHEEGLSPRRQRLDRGAAGATVALSRALSRAGPGYRGVRWCAGMPLGSRPAGSIPALSTTYFTALTRSWRSYALVGVS
jgi:hypothetical protein